MGNYSHAEGYYCKAEQDDQWQATQNFIKTIDAIQHASRAAGISMQEVTEAFRNIYAMGSNVPLTAAPEKTGEALKTISKQVEQKKKKETLTFESTFDIPKYDFEEIYNSFAPVQSQEDHIQTKTEEPAPARKPFTSSVKIQLRHDTWDNFQKSNCILLQGEVAFASWPDPTNPGYQNNLMFIGDGCHTCRELYAKGKYLQFY